jgi:hypothetical protein
MTEAEKTELREAKNKLARMSEKMAMNEAGGLYDTTVATIQMPATTRARLRSNLCAMPILNEQGDLDRTKFETLVKDTVKAEMAYLQETIGGPVRGMGSSVTDPGANFDAAKAEIDMVESFKRMGYSESAAKLAAAGRTQ